MTTLAVCLLAGLGIALVAMFCLVGRGGNWW